MSGSASPSVPPLQRPAPAAGVPARSPRPTRTELRALELRSHIARTAAEIFVADGSTSTTVERIAEAAGVHPRTFHRHFPVKEDVVLPIFADSTARLVQALRETPARGDLAEAVVTAWAPTLIEGFGDGFGRTLMGLLVSAPEYRYRWLQMDEQIADAVAEFLARRSPTRDDDLLRALPAALLVQAVRHAVERWVISDGATDVVALLRRAVRTVLTGIEATEQPDGPDPVTPAG